MIKQLFVGLAIATLAVACHAAVDANRATRAELETIDGIGPSVSGRIIDERNKGAFKDWPDLIDRVTGVGEGNAARFSADGLTVDGAPYRGRSAGGRNGDAKVKAKDGDAAKSAKAPAASAPAKK